MNKTNKTVYIFTRLPNAYAPKRLLSDAVEMGLDAKVIDYKAITFDLSKDSASVMLDGSKLSLPDAVIFRAPGMDGFCTATRDALLSFYINNSVRVLNGDTFKNWSTLDKLTQHIKFQEDSIPFIESKVYTDIELIKRDYTSYPIIVKSYLGSHGDGVKKISSEKDFDLLNSKDAPFLVQPFLKAGKDVRVIILGGKALGAMLRVAQDGAYLTNFSAGGAVELFDLKNNPEVTDIAEKAAKSFLCEYAGVDLMQDDNGEWRVLEINRSCQFEGFEQATKDNVAKKLLSYLL